jgi:hypothetical protein
MAAARGFGPPFTTGAAMTTQYDEVESGGRYPLIDELLDETDELFDEADEAYGQFETSRPAARTPSGGGRRVAPQRTDYMSIEEFRRRANEQIRAGWTPILPKQVVLVTPKFDIDFDKFAANVAYELRHYIVYRTDGGKFARGLVRATGQLTAIHGELRKRNYPVGQKITLAAALYRRSHPEPTGRWMMSVQFALVNISPDEAEKVTASPAVTAQSDRNLAEKVLNWAAQAAKEPRWAGDRKKRIGDWAELARKVGYPKFLDLWHYNRDLVALFVQYQFRGKRKAMTGGKPPPYDGTYRGIPWRVYPFKLIMDECKKRDNCYAHVANQLALSERNILAMISEVHKAATELANLREQDIGISSWTGSLEAKFGDLAPFLRDLKKQLYDVRSLMGAFTKHPG